MNYIIKSHFFGYELYHKITFSVQNYKTILNSTSDLAKIYYFFNNVTCYVEPIDIVEETVNAVLQTAVGYYPTKWT